MRLYNKGHMATSLQLIILDEKKKDFAWAKL